MTAEMLLRTRIQCHSLLPVRSKKDRVKEEAHENEGGIYLIASATQKRPTTTSEKVVWTVVDRFHDGAPVQVDRTLCEWYVDRTAKSQICALVVDIKTHSSQFLTSSSCMLGIELM